MSAQEQPEHNTPLSQQRWQIDVSKDENIPIYIRRGETVRLSMYYVRYGDPLVIPEGYTATLYYQTIGMEGWWGIPATIMDDGEGGRVDAVWGPEHDNGDEQYVFNLLITSPDSQVLCRGGGTLNMRYAPGAVPNVIPLPVSTIDFNIVNYLNAPWVLPSEMDTAIDTAIDAVPPRRTDDDIKNVMAPTIADLATAEDLTGLSSGLNDIQGDVAALAINKADKTTVASTIDGLSDIYLGIGGKAVGAVHADHAASANTAGFASTADHANSADNAGDAGTVNGFTVAASVPADAKFTDTITDISGKADKVLPYTHLTGANVTVSPSMSYVWETTAGPNVLTATGFTEGVDASCSMVITMLEGDTITASGLTFVDELEAGINHCFIRQMPTGEPKLFVSYVGVYGDIFVDGSAPAGGDGTSWRTPYKQIQDAIDGATDGDLILVKPGTYTPIDTANKAITIESVAGAGTTIIDGGGTDRCATLGESVGQHDTVLNGFTLQNGEAGDEGTYLFTMGGGGALCGVLNNCTLKQNNTVNGHYGGGASYSVLNSCVLSNNNALEGGGSAYSTLNNCILKNNTAEMSGGGAYYGTLNNCTLVGNGSGGEASAAHSATLNNCIAWGGSSPDETNQGGSVFNYCNIDPPQPGTGNISQDPKFVSGSNLRLQSTSPCINAGSNDLVVGDKDLDGNPRKVGTVDMGAYEYQGG